MSQDANPHTKRLQPSPDASPFSAESLGSDVIAAGSFPVESYADRLMDDLFGDVERLLDSGAKPSTEPVRLEPPIPESTAPKRSSFVDLVSPLVRRSTVEADAAANEEDYEALLATRKSVERSLAPKPFMASMRDSVRSYDRLLLGVGCLSLLTVLAVWLLNRSVQRPVAPLAVAPQSVGGNAAPSNTTSDNQFINYLQQALKAIDDQQQPAGSTPANSNGTSANLPTVALPGSPTIQPSPQLGQPHPTLPAQRQAYHASTCRFIKYPSPDSPVVLRLRLCLQ